MHDGDNPVKGLPFLNGYLYGKFPNLVAEGASIQTKLFICITSKYLNSCWSYRKTKATLLRQITYVF